MRQSRRGGLGQGRSRSQRPTHSRSMANSVRPRRGGVYKGNNAANQMRQANKVTKLKIFNFSFIPLETFLFHGMYLSHWNN